MASVSRQIFTLLNFYTENSVKAIIYTHYCRIVKPNTREKDCAALSVLQAEKACPIYKSTFGILLVTKF